MSFSLWLVLIVFFLSTGSYLLLTLISALPARDLKKAYNAKWALVTGASSGNLASPWLQIFWPADMPHQPQSYWVPQALGWLSPRNLPSKASTLWWWP